MKGEKGQLITLEAIIAALILFGAAFFFINFLPTYAVDENPGFTETRLAKTGQDAMEIILTKSIAPTLGYDYALYREWNSTEDDGEKWRWEENGTRDGDGTSVDRTKKIYGKVGEEWTFNNLVINYSRGENKTVWFAVKHKKDSIDSIVSQGKLFYLSPYHSGSQKFFSNSSNKMVLDSENFEGRSYGATMIWFEEEGGNISNPIYVWLNATPEKHDGVVTINETNSEGEISSFYHSARLSRRQTVYVDINTSRHEWGGQFNILPNEEGVTYQEIGDTKDIKRYKITFSYPALGGYAVYWGTGSSDKWSDPVFISVGQHVSIGRQISPLSNAINPVRAGYFKDEFRSFLNESIPKNIDYKFAVYSLKEGGSEMVAENSAGTELIVGKDKTPLNPVVVNRYIVANNGTSTNVYNARLSLWYK